MEQYYVVFSSITHAMKIEKHVKLPGKRCSIVRTPAEFGLGGCGYSIKTDSEEYARHILKEAKNFEAKTNGVYCIKSTGEVEALT